MLETLFCGNQVKMNNQVGTHHGEEEDLAGILNVVQCLKCLDTPFDIHCGGVDLTFPHHENEIAQSCSAFKPNSEPENFTNTGFIMGL